MSTCSGLTHFASHSMNTHLKNTFSNFAAVVAVGSRAIGGLARGLVAGFLLAAFAANAWSQNTDATGAHEARVEAVRLAMQADTAEEAVADATEQVLGLISAGQIYAETDPERFYREVEEVIAPMVDFPRFARNVMGPAHKAASDAQRNDFSEVFKWTLVRTYALALTEFRDGKVQVVPPRRPHRDADKVKVVQEVLFRGRTYTAVYLMGRGEDRVWHVQNIIIEGVNIGVNFRTQFASALRTNQGNIDAVIDTWGDSGDAQNAG